MIARRLDTTSPALCNATAACPAMFELKSGDFAIIGSDQTSTLINKLPEGSGCADHERIVEVPRATFLSAVEQFTNGQ